MQQAALSKRGQSFELAAAGTCHDAVRVGAMAETILGRPVLLSESAGRYLVPESVKSILAYASAE